MNTYMFTWNPLKWEWSHIKEQISALEQGAEATSDWATDRKNNIGKGDQFILVRVGSHPKGIVGIGQISKDIFERKHWSSDKDKKDKTLNFVELNFQRLSEEPFIILDQLESRYSNVKWTPQSNGNILAEEIAYEIFKEINHDAEINYEVHLEEEIQNNSEITETEKVQLILSRKGQGNFRKLLIKYWNRCSVTDCNLLDILIASHIKPWKDSTNIERLNPYNGLLLTPNLDKSFDKGLISFEDNGKIIISDKVSPHLNELGITPHMRVNLEKEHKPFMQYHRNNVFIQK